MKTSELQGVQLDYWVARAEGKIVEIIYGHCVHPVARYHDEIQYEMYKPSFDWAVGGPILERERISVRESLIEWDAKAGRHAADGFSAVKNISGNFDHDIEGDFECEGRTYLIAAMRCYVTSKFGDEVPDA